MFASELLDVGFNIWYVFSVALFELIEVGLGCVVGLELVVHQEDPLPVIGEEVVYDLWVGCWCGSFAVWCNSACWGNKIRSNIFVSVPSKILDPVSAGAFFFFGGRASNMCHSIPLDLFAERVNNFI